MAGKTRQLELAESVETGSCGYHITSLVRKKTEELRWVPEASGPIMPVTIFLKISQLSKGASPAGVQMFRHVSFSPSSGKRKKWSVLKNIIYELKEPIINFQGNLQSSIITCVYFPQVLSKWVLSVQFLSSEVKFELFKFSAGVITPVIGPSSLFSSPGPLDVSERSLTRTPLLT